jgi:hypothetical protein
MTCKTPLGGGESRAASSGEVVKNLGRKDTVRQTRRS